MCCSMSVKIANYIIIFNIAVQVNFTKCFALKRKLRKMEIHKLLMGNFRSIFWWTYATTRPSAQSSFVQSHQCGRNIHIFIRSTNTFSSKPVQMNWKKTFLKLKSLSSLNKLKFAPISQKYKKNISTEL